MSNYPAGEQIPALFFKLQLDSLEIGGWTSIEGLGVQVQVKKQSEGGVNGWAHTLPGPVTYSNIKLTRAVDRDSSKLANWVSQNAFAVQGHRSAEIFALRPDGTVLSSWKLDRVVPVSWTGPSLGLDKSNTATETLELAHHGFVVGDWQRITAGGN